VIGSAGRNLIRKGRDVNGVDPHGFSGCSEPVPVGIPREENVI
jgi:hypothetical protein